MYKTILTDAKGDLMAITDEGKTIKIENEVAYPPIDLIHTVEDMTSDDYERRFVAEYYQAKIRYDKLDRMTVKYEAGTLDFKPKCSLELLLKQKALMGNYLRVLKIRAEIEGITLY